ncbi:hypothetical protein S101413_03391 [Bacillus velezensis]|nr:hypothetical protein S101413_03391 [Bacillus velezensis]
MRRQDLNLMNVIREIVNQPRDLGSHNRSDGGEHKGNQADENEINEQDRQCPGDFFLKQAHDRIKMKNKMPEIKIGKNRVVIKPKNG